MKKEERLIGFGSSGRGVCSVGAVGGGGTSCASLLDWTEEREKSCTSFSTCVFSSSLVVRRASRLPLSTSPSFNFSQQPRQQSRCGSQIHKVRLAISSQSVQQQPLTLSSLNRTRGKPSLFPASPSPSVALWTSAYSSAPSLPRPPAPPNPHDTRETTSLMTASSTCSHPRLPLSRS
jgi:hypothetical protein